MSLLEGPRENRTNEQARARIPMNAAQVRHIIDQMMAVRGRRATVIDRCRRMGRNAIAIGNISEDAKAVWREWLDRNP
ncbi:MAG: hypothetical protein ACK4U0_17385 [Mesorhizobium sp.]